jgi:hypothetical protein
MNQTSDFEKKLHSIMNWTALSAMAIVLADLPFHLTSVRDREYLGEILGGVFTIVMLLWFMFSAITWTWTPDKDECCRSTIMADLKRKSVAELRTELLVALVSAFGLTEIILNFAGVTVSRDLGIIAGVVAVIIVVTRVVLALEPKTPLVMKHPTSPERPTDPPPSAAPTHSFSSQSYRRTRLKAY